MPETTEDLKALGFVPKPLLRAIQAKCLDCSGGFKPDVTNCLVKTCELYPFRLGKNPWRAPTSDAMREVARRNAAGFRKRDPLAGV